MILGQEMGKTHGRCKGDDGKKRFLNHVTDSYDVNRRLGKTPKSGMQWAFLAVRGKEFNQQMPRAREILWHIPLLPVLERLR